MLKVVHVPNAVLIKKAEPVGKITKKIRKIVADMEVALVNYSDPPGVGLAAPQVGIALRIFLVKPTPDDPTEVFINPIILKSEGDKMPLKRPKKSKNKKKRGELEGCLSVPRVWSPLKRPQKVQVQWTDLEGQIHTEWFTGFRAVIVQHETDHIDGILFTRRALEQGSQLYREKDGELEKIDTL